MNLMHSLSDFLFSVHGLGLLSQPDSELTLRYESDILVELLGRGIGLSHDLYLHRTAQRIIMHAYMYVSSGI
jgi:hypothetical protein